MTTLIDISPPLVPSQRRLHNASMANVLIRDVPADVHAALKRKADARHLSLQEFLSIELGLLARRRTMEEIFDEIETLSGGVVGFEAAVNDLDEDRAAR